MTSNLQEEYGKELRENNEKIVHCLLELKTQRDELMFLIDKQIEERKKLEMEMERLTYKLCLINKSMAQRMKAKQNYDSTIDDIEEKYNKLKEDSGDLMHMVEKDYDTLDSIINKKTSTEELAIEPSEHSDHSTAKNSAGTNTNRDATEEVSSTFSSKGSKEECECLPNKYGKCIREKMASKIIQATPPEPEVPIKLEKESVKNTGEKEKQKHSHFSTKDNSEKSAQTFIMGEPEISDEESRALEAQKTKLTRAASEYKEASLRRST